MSADASMLIGRGIYSVPEAARLTGVSPACIRRWLKGYTYKVAVGERAARAVVTHEFDAIGTELALSFLDLIEVKIVDSLRQRNISWRSIRQAERNARDLYGIDHPFATKQFKTDGIRIFADLRKTRGEQPLLDLTQNQFAFRQVVGPTLKNLEFNHKDQASRWRPLGPGRRVLLDPGRNFGQPIVPEGVPTAILSRAVDREGSAERVAKWYEVDPRAVRDAVEFERGLAA